MNGRRQRDSLVQVILQRVDGRPCLRRAAEEPNKAAVSRTLQRQGAHVRGMVRTSPVAGSVRPMRQLLQWRHAAPLVRDGDL